LAALIVSRVRITLLRVKDGILEVEMVVGMVVEIDLKLIEKQEFKIFLWVL